MIKNENGEINEEEFLKEAKRFLGNLVIKSPSNSLLEVAVKLIEEKNLKLNKKDNEIN
jgi:hypothetical protein